MVDLESYDHYIVAFSGGKDSTACLLHLLDQGVLKEKIELWHHLVDGRQGTFMDWPCTKNYCKSIADAFKIPIFFSWKEDGFKGEMLRNNQPTKPNYFEVPAVIDHNVSMFRDRATVDNLVECSLHEMKVKAIRLSGGKGPLGTRMKFPQVSPDLRVRWCSAYLKIDVCTAAINNQERFNRSRTLVITGERADESAARAKYKVFEPDRSDNRYGCKRRHVDHWRPVHEWHLGDIWGIIGNYKINPHPAYKLGWGRLSCMFCIFGGADQWASAREAYMERFIEIADYERDFGITIKRNGSVEEVADAGTPYKMDENLIRIAIDEDLILHEPVFVDDWFVPAGAYQPQIGPT